MTAPDEKYGPPVLDPPSPDEGGRGSADTGLVEDVFDASAFSEDVELSAIESLPPAPLRAVSEVPAPHGPDPRLGMTLVGRYRLEKLIGRGGMGRVYRAIQLPLNRPVAIKILSPEFQQKDPQFVRRFFLEAASAARLTHPNTITVFDYGESEAGELFISMEYLRGRPLSRVITTEGPFEAERVLHVGMQISRALREAHAKGIIHRDLKPGNILLLEEGDDGDFVKVLDFGLVKLFAPERLRIETDPDPELTKAGMFLGSPKYMSPEQIQGRALDPRTDIYALGVLMFQMASGKPPFTGGSSVDVIYRHVNEPVPSLASLGIEAPPELEQVIRRCLAKRREDRYNSMNDLLVRMKEAHRALTGVSMAETSYSIDVDDVGVRTRPNTHPRTAAVEAAFVDTQLTDGHPAVVPEVRRARLATAGAWAAGGALALAFGTLAYLMASPARIRDAAPEPEAPIEMVPRPQVVLHLRSEPSGAEVFHDGVSLGPTPTTARFAPDPERSRVVRFVFRAPGYEDEVKEVRLGDADVKVNARLQPQPPPGDADETRGDYKDNPY